MKRYRYPIIGSTVYIIDTAINGKIVDETKHTIVVVTSRGEKRLFKKNIDINIKNVTIHGQQLIGRPEERIKR